MCLEESRLRYLPESSSAVDIKATLRSGPMDLAHAFTKPSFNGVLQRRVLGITVSVAIRTFRNDHLGSSTNRLQLGLLNVLEEDFDKYDKVLSIYARACVR